MTHKLALFWILWGVLLVVMVGCCIFEGWSEDTALLGGTYALSLLSTWLCHKAKPKAAFVNLIVMIAYNAILSYNLVFNSQYGAGLTWWFFALLLNTIHSIGLMIFVLLSTQKRNL
jgi:ABC-type multidrug transport system permease subunit